jgi:FkbH-like protein
VKVSEALQLVNRAPKNAAPFQVVLACGFTPLHLQTFLAGHLQQRLTDRRVAIRAGLYGNLASTLEDAARGADAPDAVAVAIEWSDLDPRLGYREGGSWENIADILASAASMRVRIAAAIERIPAGIAVAVALPTLPLPPLFSTPLRQRGEAELSLEQGNLELASRLLGRPGTRLLSGHWLAEISPASSRFDLKSDLTTGLPYALTHADALAGGLCGLLAPPPRKKGLITDLDDTLWHGIAGEVGPDGVSWDLASHHPLHGLYQKLLASLAGQGILIGVASKNDASVVDQTFARPDILLPPSKVFPIEAHWNAKSGSIERILQTWNIGADSVVFVDDSPMELAEVQAAHPGIECILFPKQDYAGCDAMLRRLRDLFGADRVSEEDRLRMDSIRQGAVFQEAAAGGTPEDFLAQAGATVTFHFGDGANDARALELVNKTNQFNLNGIRYTEADWARHFSQAGSFAAVVAYKDRFGPLGKIGVLLGNREGDAVSLRAWVMSCRAFARRIEHASLRALFDRLEVQCVEFEYSATPRNGPLRETLEYYLGSGLTPPFELSRDRFYERCPVLSHETEFL